MNPDIYSRCLREAKPRRIKGCRVSEPQWGEDPGVTGKTIQPAVVIQQLQTFKNSQERHV